MTKQIAELAAAVREATDTEIGPGATPAEFEAVESRLGISVKGGFREYYAIQNGSDEPTSPDSGWLQLWFLDEWQKIQNIDDMRSSPGNSDYGRLVVFADHCLSCWSFAADFDSVGSETDIYIVDAGFPPKLIASSFERFLEAALNDDDSIYR